MTTALFDAFFQGRARDFLVQAVDLALAEDGPELTGMAVFSRQDLLRAEIVAKEQTLVAGLPITRLVLERAAEAQRWPVARCELLTMDGDLVRPGTTVASFQGAAPLLLKAERVMLNFLTHLSGVANLTRQYVDALDGTRTRLLDTRKTLPGLRYPEKYAVLVGGGCNHRLDLAQMLMLKDNHVDRAGSIAQAVDALRNAYAPCPPIEVECRDLDEVRQAVACGVERIMLDNMGPDRMRQALALIPEGIETEASGGVSLGNIRELALAGPDFISVGRLTHSAAAADFSMRVAPF